MTTRGTDGTSGRPPDRAEFAAAYREGAVAITSQAIAPLLAAARVGPGARLLDVACGSGEATAAAADRGAVAHGVDVSPVQIAAAARRFPAIPFRIADAAGLPFGSETFDIVIANFGLPHFARPETFFGEAFRVLSAGGRIAFTAWVDPADERLPTPADLSAESDRAAAPSGAFFRFGDAEKCRASLAAAGFGDITIAAVPVSWRPAAPEALIEAIVDAVARAAPLPAAPTPAAGAALRDALRARIDAETRGGAFGLPMPAIVASARKP